MAQAGSRQMSPTRTPARRGRPGYDVDSLLEICVREFNAHGYDATSISMLADALGVSKSAIYHHVESKESLLNLALERALGGLDEVIRRAEQEASGSLESIEVLLRKSVALLVAEQPYVTLLLRLRGNSPAELAAMERRRAATQRIDRLVAAAQQAGHLRHDLDARVVTRLMLGMVNSLAEWYRVDGAVGPEELARTATSLVLDGVKPQQG